MTCWQIFNAASAASTRDRTRLFIDTVDSSKLRINPQTELLRKLNEIVSGTRQFREADAEGKLIRLPTGDGTILANQ